MSRTAAPQRLRVALVRRAHGVAGEVRAEPCGGDWRRFTRGEQLRVESSGRALTVRAARDGGNGSVLMRFDEVEDAAAAEALQGEYLLVDVTQARRLGRDEWFDWQLQGLRVCDPTGADLGVVGDVEPGVSNDVLVVRSAGAVRRYPMVRAFVIDVDLESGVLTLQPQDEV